MTQPGAATGGSLESLLLPNETLRSRVIRRARGLVIEVGTFALLTALCAPLVVVGALVDFALWLRRRKPWMALRLLAFAWWTLFCELRGIAGLTWLRLITLGRAPHVDRRAFVLRKQWLGGQLRGLRRIFGLEFDVDGLPLAGGGPLVILIRHASTVDTLLPETFIAIEHDMWLRYVLKRELLNLPTIDMGRRWVPTVFVSRGAADLDSETARIALLGTGLATDDAVLIYPEGTLFSPTKLVRAQRLAAKRRPELAGLASGLRHVLPPKLVGPTTLLQAAAEADVLIVGHVGLDSFEYPRDMWRGDLVGSTVHMKFWRFPADTVPRDDAGLAQWIYERWAELDEWVEGKIATRP
jgi:1-acyl-sn-glycerol-3-phosphate acyltransferase